MYLSEKLKEVNSSIAQWEAEAIRDYELRIAQAKIDFADDPDYLERSMRVINKAFEASVKSNKILLTAFQQKIKGLIRS